MNRDSARKQLHKLLEQSVDSLCALSDVPHKQVGMNRYLHLYSCGCPNIADNTIRSVSALCTDTVAAEDILMKVSPTKDISLLVYPDFFRLPHPTLRLAANLSQSSGQLTVREYRENPPVLHRKELLLPPIDSRRKVASELTRAEDAAGLLDRPFNFGFQKQWDGRLQRMGYTIRGYELRRL